MKIERKLIPHFILHVEGNRWEITDALKKKGLISHERAFVADMTPFFDDDPEGPWLGMIPISNIVELQKILAVFDGSNTKLMLYGQGKENKQEEKDSIFVSFSLGTSEDSSRINGMTVQIDDEQLTAGLVSTIEKARNLLDGALGRGCQ